MGVASVVQVGCFVAGWFLVSSCSGTNGSGAGEGVSAVKSRQQDGQVIALGEAEGFKALEQRFAFDSRSLKRDEKGNFTGPVRSRYDKKRNISFGGGVGKSVYEADNYRAPDWQGSGKVLAGKYPSKTQSYRSQQKRGVPITSPAHLVRHSRFQGLRTHTGSFPVRGARETGALPVNKPSDQHTEFRREVFPAPPIVSDEEYNRRSVEQMRNLLGRDE